MRITPPLILAVLVAIAVAIGFVWLYPASILEVRVAPAGTPLREVYNAQSITELPLSIQDLMKYQYPLAALYALCSFGAVYFGFSMQSSQRWLIVAGCLLPIVSFLFEILVLLSILIALGLLVWLLILYARSDTPLPIPLGYCFAMNALSSVLLGFYLMDILAIIT